MRYLVQFKFYSNTSKELETESGWFTESQFLKRLKEVKVHNIDVFCIKEIEVK